MRTFVLFIPSMQEPPEAFEFTTSLSREIMSGEPDFKLD